MKHYVDGVLQDMSEADIAWATEQAAKIASQNLANKQRAVRDKRDELLRSNVDSLNPIRWAALTDAQKTAFGVYRQELLDVPQQAGFPNNVTWPTKPE